MGCLSPNARKNRFPSRHPAALVPNLAASQLLTLGQRLVPIFSNHGDGAVRFLTICHDLFSWTLNAPVFCIMVATTKYMQCIGSAAKMSFTRTCLYTFHVGNVGYRLVWWASIVGHFSEIIEYLVDGGGGALLWKVFSQIFFFRRSFIHLYTPFFG